MEPRRGRHLVFADDLFQLSKVPKQKTVHVISKAVEKLSGCKLYNLQFYSYQLHIFWSENLNYSLLLPLLSQRCESCFLMCRPLANCTDQLPKHVNFSQFIASNVPSLKGFCQHSTNLQNGISALQALSSAMVSLQRYMRILCHYMRDHIPLAPASVVAILQLGYNDHHYCAEFCFWLCRRPILLISSTFTF